MTVYRLYRGCIYLWYYYTLQRTYIRWLLSIECIVLIIKVYRAYLSGIIIVYRVYLSEIITELYYYLCTEYNIMILLPCIEYCYVRSVQLVLRHLCPVFIIVCRVHIHFLVLLHYRRAYIYYGIIILYRVYSYAWYYYIYMVQNVFIYFC